MDTGSFDKLVNRIIDKRYKIESAIGIGGMAYVLKAKDILDDKTVAIKFLNDEFKDDERAVKRFINESKAISMLSHENIVKIYDVVINEERKYIVMEFIDGITLKDYIDKIGVLGWKEAIHYTKQILAALDHAHEKLIIHRDIKPQNIMLLPDGTVKVTDFGIAKQQGAESITMTDKAIGTVNYISPEQASGGAVDARSDIYSVGVMLYEMVTGKLPFIADSPVAVAMMQVSNEPLSPREVNSQVPVGLEQIILKAMQKNADERFSGAVAMLKALNYFAKNPEIVFAGSVTDTGATGAKLKKSDYIDAKKKEEKLKKKRRGSRSMFPIVSGIACAAIIVLLVATSALWMPVVGSLFGDSSGNDIDNMLNAGSETLNDILGGGTDAQKINVASFVDKIYDDELINEMEKLGYTVDAVKFVKDERKATNTVIKQYPEIGATRLKPVDGSLIPVTLYVNMSDDEMYMPDCVLMSENAAKALIAKDVSKLIGKEFSSSAITVKYYSHDTYPKGYVINTVPAADTFIDKNELPEFIISVSMGKEIENAVIPELEGKTKEEVVAAINGLGVSVGKLTYEIHPIVEEGMVIRASHKYGDVVAKGITTVDLWISIGNGKEKAPEDDEAVEDMLPEEGTVPETDSHETENSSGNDVPNQENSDVTRPESENTTSDSPIVADISTPSVEENSADTAENEIGTKPIQSGTVPDNPSVSVTEEAVPEQTPPVTKDEPAVTTPVENQETVTIPENVTTESPEITVTPTPVVPEPQPEAETTVSDDISNLWEMRG